jgi:hypothetical protein
LVKSAGSVKMRLAGDWFRGAIQSSGWTPFQNYVVQTELVHWVESSPVALLKALEWEIGRLSTCNQLLLLDLYVRWLKSLNPNVHSLFEARGSNPSISEVLEVFQLLL